MNDAPIVLSFEEWMMRDLTELVKLAYDENPAMRALSYSENRVQEMIATAIFAPNRVGGFASVNMEKKEIVGIIVATVSGVSFSDEPIASDVISFVKAERRDGPAPATLLEAYEKWASRKGVKKIYFTDHRMFSKSPIEGWEFFGSRTMRSI